MCSVTLTPFSKLKVIPLRVTLLSPLDRTKQVPAGTVLDSLGPMKKVKCMSD